MSKFHAALHLPRLLHREHGLRRFTTREDLDYTTTALGEVLEELATTVRFLSCK